MSTITTGRITTRRGARVHLAVDGRIADNAAAHITYPNQPGHADLDNLCRRCWTSNRITAAQRALATATGPKAEAARQLLSRAADTLATPEQRAELDALAARIVRDLEAAQAPTQDRAAARQAAKDQRAAARRAHLANRPTHGLSQLGVLATVFAATHQQPSNSAA